MSLPNLVRCLPTVSAAVLALVSSPSAVWAQEEETVVRLTAPKLFPEKTLVYVRVDDVQQLKSDMATSSIGKLGNDDQLKPILDEFYGSLVNNTEQIEQAIGLNLDELLSIPSGEMAVALIPGSPPAEVEREGEDGERVQVSVRPTVAILLDAGDEISSVQVLLARIDEERGDNLVHEEKEVGRLLIHRYRNPNRRREQFAYFIDDGVIVASSNAEFTEKLAKKWLGNLPDAKTLADNRKFTSIMSRCVGTEGERPQVSFYADPMAMVREFTPRNAATSMTLAMLPALGLDGIEAVGGSWIVAPPNFDSISHMHLLLSSPRKAVLGLLRPKSGSTEPESWVPDSVASYSTINWDIASTLEGVEKLFNMFRGEDALQQQVFDPLSERLEIDFRKDVLNNLEGRLTMLQGFVRPVTINSGSNVYAIRLNNPEYFKANTLPKLIEEVEKRTEVRLESSGSLRYHVLQIGRRTPADAPIRSPQICAGVLDDYLIIADSQYMMQEIAKCVAGNTLPLVEMLEYQLISDRIAAQLQDKECAGISFARPEESLQLFYELARDPQNRERLRSVADGNGFFKALLSALEKHELPPFSVIAKYLAPGGGYLVEEETGMHYMSFSLRRE